MFQTEVQLGLPISVDFEIDRVASEWEGVSVGYTVVRTSRVT